MASFLRIACGALGSVVVALFAAILALTFLQVINRYLLGFQLFWTEEVIRLLLVWMVLIATPVVLYRHQEIKVDLLALRSNRLMRAKRFLAGTASVTFCALLAWWGYEFMERAIPSNSVTLGVSRAWFYAPLPIGAALSVLILLSRPAETHAELGVNEAA